MSVLFVDLDGTLADRDDAVARWAREIVAERGLDPSVVDQVLAADGRGLRPKPEVAADLVGVLGLSEQESATIIEVLRAGVVRHVQLAPGVEDALARARQAGWTIIIVTNGATHQQQAKLDKLGVVPMVDGYVISEECGVEKPDPAIFDLALATVPGADRLGAWHIGDSAEADIQGAHNAGINSVYLRHGRDWTPGIPAPTAFADSFSEAVDTVLTSSAG
ncbi:HAD family hydrolase [Propionibacteriaceae bacterium Y1923]|uniref:HAD family hydrolase n=1 Tax=Aestuariimicrobium sp. Y1814 TaxID=3418742 RepID=UPI003C1909C2